MPERLLAPRGAGRAEERAHRLFAAGAGAAAALTIVLSLAFVAVRDAGPASEGFEPLILPGLLVIVAMGASAPWLPLRVLRMLAGCGAAACLVGTVIALGAPIPRHIGVWTHTVTVAIVLSWQLAGGLLAAWSLLGLGAAAAVVQRVASGAHSFAQVVNESQVLLTGVVIGAIAALALDEARRLDAAAVGGARAARESATQRGRLVGRSRAAAVIHDDVLSTLRLAGSDLPIPADRLAQQAAAGVGSLHALADEDRQERTLLAGEIGRLAERVAPDAAVTLLSEPSAQTPYDVRDAFVGAVRQALDNSVRHAGTATRTVLVDERADRVSVVVSDDGAGFDLDAIGEERLGVRTSIIQRLREVGGSASVASRPGGGTSVLLEWAAPTGASAALAIAEPPRILRAHVAVVWTVCLFATMVPALGATASASPAWAPVALGVLILTGSQILRWWRVAVPSVNRSVTTVMLLLGVVLAGVTVAPFTGEDTWYATSSAFLLIALATRGRPAAALASAAVLAGVLATAGILRGTPVDVIAAVVTQPVLLVALACLLATLVARMRAGVYELYDGAIASIERAARDAAGRAELSERVAHVDALVGPLLERIARGETLTDEDRRTCLATEGRLRDELRAGRLAIPVLVDAVARARRRGVDVVVLDDRDSDEAAENTLVELAERMARGIDGARSRAVARLLPAGRGEEASLTVDGEPVPLRDAVTASA